VEKLEKSATVRETPWDIDKRPNRWEAFGTNFHREVDLANSGIAHHYVPPATGITRRVWHSPSSRQKEFDSNKILIII